MVDIEIDTGLNAEEQDEARKVVERTLFGYIATCVNRPQRISIRKDDQDWLIEVEMNQPQIVRTRRITGYLSSLSNFHDAKKAEERDRRCHAVVNQRKPASHPGMEQNIPEPATC